jgi:hypothetical protein
MKMFRDCVTQNGLFNKTILKTSARVAFSVGVLIYVSACSLIDGYGEQKMKRYHSARSAHDPHSFNLANVELHTFELANELFNGHNFQPDARYAVVGFVAAKTHQLQPNFHHPLMQLSYQLEQGLMTEADRRGFIARDFKVAADIIMGDEGERVLSRSMQHLDKHVDVDYYITGTMVEQQGGAVVNARIIHVESKDVVSAATRFFPDTLFWEEEKVTTRNGMLYRSGSY